ncbi:Serine protease easter [Ooceraea biroi]|uniref:Serine protease easter n=1 Tax=Ooceraea biroi TaxID=2015173 RepID=A0A026WIN7_OOCBI|nr:Serine protease easter [Ooceraea biroi]
MQIYQPSCNIFLYGGDKVAGMPKINELSGSHWLRSLSATLERRRDFLRMTFDVTGHRNWKLLDQRRCGNSNSDRIIGGKNASLGAYPWIARLGYTNGIENESYKCGGTLINRLYVITAAHCVVNLRDNFRMSTVRLGEHNSLTDPDCEKDHCAEPVQDFLPESIIVHQSYNTPRNMHDIALIRLQKSVTYSDIPKTSTTLLTVKLPVVELERCKQAFSKHVDIGDQQMCVGGVLGRDSCSGDSGGPLMKVESESGPPRYYLLGIVSFGVRHCGGTTTPAIYTKVAKYITWILDNISPADGQMGTCKAARNCTAVATILQQSRDEAFAYLKRNHCGFDGKTPLVCCINNIITRPTPPNEDLYDRTLTNSGNSTPSEEGRIGVDNNPLLPSDCGRDLSQRIVGGERTSLDEFPWMALLEYQKPNGRTTACGGVLISKRYVLTAAHCIKGKDLPTTWRLSSVRLGEYDTDTDTDCISDGNNGTTCADDPVTVGVEEQFAHEEYQPLSRHQRYDIALLRLAQDVTFTKYIKPICLPSNSTSLDDRLFFVAGWGKTETRSSSNVKLKLSLPLVSDSQCDQTYNNAGVRLGYGQICAGGQRGKDSCRGDSGGPLMALERLSDRTGKWSAVGVVSFGPSPCGMQGWPGVYTKVQDFVPWILSKLRA